jgi:hypothetical protein
LGKVLWESSRSGTEPDMQRYIEELNQLI